MEYSIIKTLPSDGDLTSEEKKILMSYYVLMQKSYTKNVISLLKNNTINAESYVPIGSWAGIPEQWVGKEVCFAAITDWIIDNPFDNLVATTWKKLPMILPKMKNIILKERDL